MGLCSVSFNLTALIDVSANCISVSWVIKTLVFQSVEHFVSQCVSLSYDTEEKSQNTMNILRMLGGL